MNRHEVAVILSLAAAYDQRTIGDADVLAWHNLLADRPFADAQAALGAWYSAHSGRITVADLIAGIRAIANDRAERGKPAALTGPPGRPPSPEYTAARREVDGATVMPAGDAGLARSVRCPWCAAPAGFACIAPATGKALTITSAHAARYQAAGAGSHPRVAGDMLVERQARSAGGS